MTPRRLTLFLLAVLAVAAALPALAQEEGSVEVIDLSGALDTRIIDFAIDSIERAAGSDVEVVILQIDSPGVIDGEERLQALLDLVASPPVPVVTWIGPSPAVAFGGAAQLVLAADRAFAAPGSEIGFLAPTIAGRSGSESLPLIEGDWPDRLIDEAVGVEDVAGIEVSERTAAPRQVAQELDGALVTFAGGEARLQTVVPFLAADGTEGVSVLPTTIREPDIWDQFLRLAASPEAAFFFLVAGLTVAAFEFYAIGPGMAAGVAAICLFLASYGIATLPVRWWSVLLTVVAVWMCSAGYQRSGINPVTIAGLAVLPVTGFLFTDAAPQIRPGVAGVVLTVAAAGFFFLVAMPTVARSRFSTQTIGREGMIGQAGVAVSPLAPDGEVEVNGAHWRATSHRAAGIGPGDAIEVVGVEGWYLEVEPRRG